VEHEQPQEARGRVAAGKPTQALDRTQGHSSRSLAAGTSFGAVAPGLPSFRLAAATGAAMATTPTGAASAVAAAVVTVAALDVS
jgi:hypothetical protein